MGGGGGGLGGGGGVPKNGHADICIAFCKRKEGYISVRRRRICPSTPSKRD